MLTRLYHGTPGFTVTNREKNNQCKVCKQTGHFFNHCPVPHFVCKAETCYIAETHDHYKFKPCPIATTYVNHQEDIRNGDTHC